MATINLEPIRDGATLAIDLLSDFFGVDAAIYYPKGNYEKSGNLDDIFYDKEPSLTTSLLLLDVYTKKPIITAGASMNFTLDLIAYVPFDTKIYRFSKIVVELQNAVVKYKLVDILGHHDENDALYKQLILEPLSETLTGDEITNSNRDDFIDDITDEVVHVDNTIARQDSQVPTKPKKYYEKIELF